MRQVFLVRHTSHDRLGRLLCGRMPGVHLSAQGRAEAEAMAGALVRRVETGTLVLSSPQARAQETAAPLAQKLGTMVETSADLDEIDFGAWTGRTFADLEPDAAWTAWNGERATTRPPGGESMGEAQARALRLLDRLGRENNPPAILVSHADTIRAALLGVLGLSLDAYDRLVVAPASWSELALWPGGGRVVSINERAQP